MQTNTEALEKQVIALIRQSIKNDKVLTDDNFGFLFAAGLFDGDFDWQAQLGDIKYSLKQVLVLLGNPKLHDWIKENGSKLNEQAAEHLLRVFDFLDELEHEWKDRMELYTVMHQYNTPQRLNNLLKEYTIKTKQQEVQTTLVAG